ncbi:septum site-determining protein MinC [Paracoccus sp. JM45]|uniref:septum site-determining protein MinC n=1 Tax=Paracoccus sp. JM45 TaxID=2283626 RepID=UPI0021067303|nr:septum site-determining protein MinC [Paracoccus sp. JM45]
MTASSGTFQVRGRFLTALVLRIDSEKADGPFFAQLDEQLHRTPQFFSGAPLVLDLGKSVELNRPDNIRDLVQNLRQRDLRVFGVQNASGIDDEMLQSLGLIAVTTGRDAPLPRDNGPAKTTAAAAPAARPVENKVVRSHVRSGQMVVAENGDLTVIGSVASGAELMAAGNIHVYGALRGRALAGCHGDETAHIFCQNLSAELVAIAGLYKTSETLDAEVRQRCTHIYLEDEKLRMEVIA